MRRKGDCTLRHEIKNLQFAYSLQEEALRRAEAEIANLKIKLAQEKHRRKTTRIPQGEGIF